MALIQGTPKYIPLGMVIGNGQGIESNVQNTLASFIPVSAQQAITGAGAANVTAFYTALTSTSTDAITLANGTVIGQLKKIQLIVDGGDATLTPTTLAGGSTITFADAGDFTLLMWAGVNTGWSVIELGNAADGATAPVLA